jgi:hypothetical protein
MKIKACPVCGQEVERSCYHDGEDVRSVEMDISSAAQLVREYIVFVNQIIESAKYDLRKYNDIANDYAAQHAGAADSRPARCSGKSSNKKGRGG